MTRRNRVARECLRAGMNRQHAFDGRCAAAGPAWARCGERRSDVVDNRFFGRADKPCRANHDFNDIHGLPGPLAQVDAEVGGCVVVRHVAAVERLQQQHVSNRLSFARLRSEHHALRLGRGLGPSYRRRREQRSATSQAEQRTRGAFIGAGVPFRKASILLGTPPAYRRYLQEIHGPRGSFPTIVRFAPETRWQPSRRRGYLRMEQVSCPREMAWRLRRGGAQSGDPLHAGAGFADLESPDDVSAGMLHPANRELLRPVPGMTFRGRRSLRYVVASACSNAGRNARSGGGAKANISVGSVETDKTLICMVTGNILRPIAARVHAHALLVSPNPGDAIASDSVAGERADDGGAAGARGRSIRRGVPGASVVVRDAATGFTSTTSSDGQGPLSRAGHPGRRVPSHGRGSRVPIRAHRRADVRGRPHAGPRLPADGRHPARSGRRQRGTAAARSRDERRRTRRVGDRPFRRSRSTAATSSISDRWCPDRWRRRRPASRRTPIRGTGALAFNTTGNREEAVGYIVNGVTHQQPDVWIDQLSAAGRQHPGVQDRQLDVQRRVRPRVGRDRQPGHALGHRPVPRRGLRVLPQRRARRAQLLRVHDARPAPVRSQPVRRHVRRSDPSRPHVLLCHLRGPAAAPGHRHERRGARATPSAPPRRIPWCGS